MKNNGIFETNVIMNFLEEINRRRTFGIVSHPDAGKTTLTEKLLLFGGAIQEAGAVKSNKIKKLQLRSKFTIYSEENLYSIFTLECITNNVLVIIDKTNKYKLTFFKKRFIKIDYQNLKELRKLNKLYKKGL